MSRGEKKLVGEWAWNSTRLWSKIVKTDADKCWAWLGSSGPNTNLFGAQKNGVGQMTQARRILYRDITGEDCDDLQITMSCKNAYCMNFEHMQVKPNQRRYYADGTERGTREVVDKTAGLQRRTMKQIDKEWHLK
jgi:hypothetical protein